MARTPRHQVMRCGNRPPARPRYARTVVNSRSRHRPHTPSPRNTTRSCPLPPCGVSSVLAGSHRGGQQRARAARQLTRTGSFPGRLQPPAHRQSCAKASSSHESYRLPVRPGHRSLKSCTMIHPDTWMRARMSMRGWAAGCRPGRGYPPSPPSRQCGGSPARPGRPRPAPCGCERAGAPTPR